VMEIMMETIRTYNVRASSTVVRSGIATASNVRPSISFSAPKEFGGIAGQWTPEHFLIAALVSCYVSTFSGMASVSKFDFVLLDVAAEGTIENLESGWRFTQIILSPKIRVEHARDRERALRLAEKAEQRCLIAKSLNCVIAIYATVEVEDEEWLAARKSEQVAQPV